MAIMWDKSLFPWTDPNGAPYSGAKAYFFDAGTTTPRTVYLDADHDEVHDHPVVANASGMFPAVFLPTGEYRLRIARADGVVLWDVDGISTPSVGDGGGGGGGDTPVELLARTADYKWRHATGSHSGWVRANGRTIGGVSSGATERANADCEDLFLHLWDQDPTLVVSGSRGANAASDWAASKTIALPDIRLRALIGLADMGNSTSTIIAAADFDGAETGTTLGSTVGAGRVTLTTAQMPVHNHTGSADSAGAHTHTYNKPKTALGVYSLEFSGYVAQEVGVTSSDGAHVHNLTIANAGSGQSHANVQPSATATCYIKL